MVKQDQQVVADVPTVGERLRAARKAKRLSLDDVARQTRIPIRHLEHIERGEWDALPAITYSVGFARSYASAVGLDGPAVGAELREQLGGGGGIRNSGAPSVAHYEPADPARVPPRPLAIATIVLVVLLVGGYMVWRSSAVGDSPADAALEQIEAPATAPHATPQRPPGPAAAAPAAANGPVVLTAAQEVWLRIYQKGGPKLYEGTLKAGEHYEVPAAAQAPLILTGRPDAIQVTVGGRPIPPLGAPQKTIADVSLRPADLVARLQPGAAPGPQPGGVTR
ncbi:MAG TPA: RodZ domain-containing protein [Allosphingosinicella sp.]|jgi:hypothetical protein